MKQNYMNNKSIAIKIRYLWFLQRCCWRFTYSRMLHQFVFMYRLNEGTCFLHLEGQEF